MEASPLSPVEEFVLRLRKQGKNQNEIAASDSRLTKDVVRDAIQSLIEKGKLHGIRAFNYDPEDERLVIIIEMLRKRLALQWIALKLGITRERVRQLKGRIVNSLGSDILKPKKQEEVLYTISEAAELTGIPQGFVWRLCQKDKTISFTRRGEGQKAGILLPLPALKEIKKKAKKKKEAICVICGRRFKRRKKQSLRKTCSRKCQIKRRDIIRQKLLASEPGPDNLWGWHLKLWRRIKEHNLPEDEEWLTFNQALVVFRGLSKTQIDWLGRRRIVSTKKHSDRTWHGRPVIQFSRSELKAAAQVWQAEKKRRKRKNNDNSS